MPSPTLVITEPTALSLIAEELDLARRKGPLKDIRVPPCPDLLLQLRKAVDGPEPDLQLIASLAAADVAIAAALILQANGALHAAGAPIHHVGAAMDRLGLDATVRTMTGFAARHAIRVDHPALREFWQQSARRAEIMVFLSEQLPGMSADLAFGFGLFQHVGMPVLMQSVRGYAGTLAEARARVDRSFIATENANHRTDHAVVGALVARTWRLSPEVMAAIRLHHDLHTLEAADINAEVRSLLACGLMAEHLAARLVSERPSRDWAAHGRAALDWLGVGEDDLRHWEAELADRAC